MKFLDKIPLEKVRVRQDGSLIADAAIARTGIQLYAGHEVGRPDLSVVRVYRPPEEVFARDAMASFAHRPVTNDHPPVDVTAENWKDFAVGHTADEVMRDGELLRVPLMVSDGSAVDDVNAGKRELSSGYQSELIWADGIAPGGEQYDAKMTKIRANHVAIVKHGRAGSAVGIGDNASAESWGAAPIINPIDRSTNMAGENLRTMVVDGLSVQTTDQGAQAIDKLQGQINAAKTAHDSAISAKDTEIADLKKQIETKDGEIKALEKKVEDAAVSPEKLNAMVKDRAALLATAKATLGDKASDFEDKTDEDIMKAVVGKHLGDSETAKLSADGLRGAYLAFAKDAGKKTASQPAKDGLRDALKYGAVQDANNGDWGQSIFDKAGIKSQKQGAAA